MRCGLVLNGALAARTLLLNAKIAAETPARWKNGYEYNVQVSPRYDARSVCTLYELSSESSLFLFSAVSTENRTLVGLVTLMVGSTSCAASVVPVFGLAASMLPLPVGAKGSPSSDRECRPNV